MFISYLVPSNYYFVETRGMVVGKGKGYRHLRSQKSTCPSQSGHWRSSVAAPIDAGGLSRLSDGRNVRSSTLAADQTNLANMSL